MNEFTVKLQDPPIQPEGRVCLDDFFVWTGGVDAFIEAIIARAAGQQRTLACYLNAHTYNLACEDQQLRTILSQADILYPDGVSIAWAVRRLRGVVIDRMTGVDFFPKFLRRAETASLKLYFLGGRPGVVDRAAVKIKSEFPGLKIAGKHPGEVQDEIHVKAILTDIKYCRPDVLLVGLGTPLQEQFAWKYGRTLDVPVVWTVGALFDYWAGVESPAPRWVGRIGMEWFWRLLADPRNKWRRYLIGNAKFVGRVIRLARHERAFTMRNE